MIERETVNKILDMARLEMKEEEKEKFLKQMNDILGYVELIERLDTSSIGDRESVFDEKNVMDEDKIEPGLSQTELRKFTKNYLDGYYAVPKVL